MPVDSPGKGSPLSRWRWFAVGLAAWAVVGVATWPSSPSFLDGVGYVGQARLLLDLEVRPVPASPGVWVETPDGVVAKYPLFFPLVVAPLLALSGRLVFALSFLSAAALAVLAARILEVWRREPVWGLLVLAHPTVVLLSRTVMADLLLCLAALGAWWALERRAREACALMFALLVLVKPAGISLAAALLAGEAWRNLRGRTTPDGKSALVAAAAGCGLGLVAVLGLNLVTTGGPWYAYEWAHRGRSEFAARHLATSGAAHLRTLLWVPPALLVGLYSLWRRRARGPVLAVTSLCALMSIYWFVDSGREPLEGLVLAPRLILPAVAFLLLGYADVAAQLARRPVVKTVVALGLVIAAPLMSLAVGLRHQRQQAPMLEARRSAERMHARHENGPLGVTYDAMKAGILSGAEVERFVVGGHEPCVVLCNSRSYSYRVDEPVSCELEGYRVAEKIGSLRVLVHARCD